MQMKLDTMDVKILRMLQENSRTPVSEIAARLRVSRPTIKNRIERLVREGVISRFTVEISRDALDNPLSVYLRLKADGESLGRISEVPEIVEMYRVTGRLNVLAKALIRDMEELSGLIEELRRHADEIEVELVLDTLKESEPPLQMIKAELECEYCGSNITKKPYIYKFRNVERYFCCPVCLKSYRRKLAMAERWSGGEAEAG